MFIYINLIKELVELGILDKYLKLLDCKDLETRREIYWGLSNILASTQKIISDTINHEIFERMMNIYQYEDYQVFIP